jgi:outer membrane protein assembly factor BamB
MHRRAWIAWSVAVVAALLCGAETRTWKDISGQFQIEAEYVDYAEGQVELKKTDGTVIKVPVSKLSSADQAIVRGEIQKRRKTAVPPTTQPAPATGNTSAGAVAALEGEWPQWRGPRRDGRSDETGLLDSWPAGGPPKLWSARGMGRGYSSIAVVGDTIYTLGHRGGVENIIAVSADDGSVRWTTPIGRGDHSNGTPTVDGGRVYAVSLDGGLVCADARTGREVWRKNYAQDFGGRMMSGWGFSESPLIDGDRLICTPGGSQAIIAALDKKTGQVAWTAPFPGGARRGKDGAAYSSIVVSQGAGVRQYVQIVGRGAIGVAAADGRFLWGYDQIANDTANIPTPVASGDYVFVSTGYQTGAALLKLSRSGSGVAAQEVYFLQAGDMQNHHGGMVLVNGFIYCGHGHNQGFPLCVEMLTGKPAWKPGRGEGSGSAAVTYADGNLYFRYEDGTVALIAAEPQRYLVKGTFRINTGNDKCWPHPVVAGKRLYLRDQDELHCFDIARR